MEDEMRITVETALELCEKYRSSRKVRRFTRCWGCLKFSQGDPKRMYFYDPPLNRGCGKVNRLYKKRLNENSAEEPISDG
jgi:hypothetical protein